MLALLPEYAGLTDPVAELRAACLEAVARLGEGPVSILADPQGERVARALLSAVGGFEAQAPGRLRTSTTDGQAPGRLRTSTTEGEAPGRLRTSTTDGQASGRLRTSTTEGEASGRLRASATEGQVAGRLRASATEGQASGRLRASATEGQAAGRLRASATEGQASGRLRASATEGQAPGPLRASTTDDPVVEVQGAPATSLETTTASYLVVGNGSACRTEKAPGFLDDRAAAFDDALRSALVAGDVSGVDLALGRELLASLDGISRLGEILAPGAEVTIDYDDAPLGVQYWVMRWES
ncbi:hypothetical protein [Nocardioides sp. PD653-B2]|uniref:hypothetical protein n=1 Tax=Nocardioides sp. PD653-B2 TaxID=1892811 RepID=UPI001A9972E2|nr:hypothetical protein [Nocardioides sp. PD653-B2]